MLQRVALALELFAASGPATPPSEFRIFKAGINRTMKGTCLFDEKAAGMTMAAFTEMGRDLGIDYNHAATVAAYAPNPAESGKAAGFFQLEVREGALWATNVTWTEEGARRLAAREYRYISPWLDMEEDGTVCCILNCALTNNPATFAPSHLVASADLTPTTKPTEPQPMKTLLAALALATDSSEAQAALAIEALKGERTALLSATGASTVAEAVGKLTAWKLGSERAETLSAELATIKSTAAKAELDAVLKQAVADGKVTPAQVPLLLSMPLEGLKAFIAASPKVLPTAVTAPAAGGAVVALSAEELEVAKQMGIDPKAMAATKAKLAGTAV